MITTIILRIEHKKPVPDLLDKIAGRAYTIDGVDDVTATLAGEEIDGKAMQTLIDLAYGKAV